MSRLQRILLLLVAIVGLVITGVAMERWAPESATRLPDRADARTWAAADAQALGYRILGEPWVGASNGHRVFHSSPDMEALTEQVRDSALRRRLMEAVPPIRLGVRYWKAESPNGMEGVLFLEYGGDGELLGASFGMDGVLRSGLAIESDRVAGDRLARIFLEEEPPEPYVWSAANVEERIYPGEEGQPSLYIALGTRGSWMAMRVPAPYRVLHEQQIAIWSLQPEEQVRVYVLIAAALAALGVLMWRLGQRRAGIAHGLPILVLLVATALPALAYFRSRPSVLIAISLFYLLPQLGLLLAWAVAEAEVRDVRPGSVEHWDRLMRWRPVRATGSKLLVGSALGIGLAALASGGGRLAEALGGGGYGGVLLILPDYWMMSTPIHRGFALATLTAFIVGLGGRLAGRPGAMIAAAVSACGWAYAMPVAPFGWNFALAWVMSMAVGWVLWHHGLLALVVASITAASLPTAWFAWSVVFGWAPTAGMISTALLASTPLAFVAMGLWWWQRAPVRTEVETLVPSYVSGLEQESRLQAEVALLRELQLALLPPERLCPSSGLDIAWKMVPADLVGGDYLDLVTDADGRLWIAVADVAGHGVSCSVLTAFTKAAFAEHAIAGRGPAEAMHRIRLLFDRLQTRRTMVTLLLAVWDPATRELTVATAGHPHLLVCRDGVAREVGSAGPPLGSRLPRKDREITVICPPGTLIVAYTDGVVEATSPSDEVLGYQAWPERLPALAGISATEVLRALLAMVDHHCGGRPKGDDVTALVARVADPETAANESRDGAAIPEEHETEEPILP